MKFNFKMDVKGVPNATVACEFECSVEELSVMLSDPIYQGLGEKLIAEISFAPKSHDDRKQDHRNGNRNQHQAREASEKMCGRSHQHSVTEALIKSLNRRIDELLKRNNF